MFATHVLGPHLLTDRLRAGRVVFVSSGGMYAARLPSGDYEYRTGRYRGATGYARTKRMRVVLAEQWAQRSTEDAVHSMHPGWVRTEGLAAALPGFDRLTRPIQRTPREGADTAVWLCATDQPTGGFWHDRRMRPTHYRAGTNATPEDRERLWQTCVDLTDTDPGHSESRSGAHR